MLDLKLQRRLGMGCKGALKRAFPSVHVRFLFLEGERVRKTSRGKKEIPAKQVMRRRRKQHWHLPPPSACESGNHAARRPDGQTDGRTDRSRGWTAGGSSSAPCTPSPQLWKNAILLRAHAGTDFLVFRRGSGERGGGYGVWWGRERLRGFSYVARCPSWHSA